MEIKEKLSKMRWSYSRLNTYHKCPAMFYRQYVRGQAQQENAFAQYGSFAHSLLDGYFQGKLLLYELPSLWRRGFDKCVTEEFPQMGKSPLRQTWFESGEAYFETFTGLPEKYTLVGSEIKVVAQLRRDGFAPMPFICYVDLLLCENTQGEKKFVIVDHKSHGKFKSKRERMEYARQQYLYAAALCAKGILKPHQIKSVGFNLFRAGIFDEIPWQDDAYEEALAWAFETREAIYRDTAFEKLRGDIPAGKAPMFCKNICSFRAMCLEEE